jgi:hypothetical protein
LQEKLGSEGTFSQGHLLEEQSFHFSNICPSEQATLRTFKMKGREGIIKGENYYNS